MSSETSPLAKKDINKDENNFNANLDVLRVIYIASYLLGHVYLADAFGQNLSFFTPNHLMLMLWCIVLFSLSVRFFWAIGNIRRFMRNKFELARDNGDYSRESMKCTLRSMVLLHTPILMAHSFTFLVLCKLLKSIVEQTVGGKPTGEVSYDSFVYLYCALLLLNSFWLCLLADKWEKGEPEFIWMLNNLICSLLAFGAFSYFSCGNLEYVGFCLALVIFAGNSFYDFWRCYEAYTVKVHG